MRKLGWYAVTTLVAVLILGSVLLLAANLYVQSAMVQQRIRQALTASLHMPVSIRKTTITPWEGLRIDGLTANVGSVSPFPAAPGEAGAADFLTADSFRVRFALLPLLHRQFVVTLLWLDKPQLAWAQDPDGRWQFPPGAEITRRHKKAPAPEPTAAPTPEGDNAASASPALSAALPAPPPPTPVAAPDRTPREPSGFTVALDRFRLRHGGLNFLSAKHRPIWQFEEVNLDGHLTDAPQRASGTMWFDKAWMPRVGLTLTQFHSNFAYDRDDGLTLSDSGAMFAGGTVAARCQIHTQEPGSPFSAECRVEQVKLEQLLKEIGNHMELVEGSLQGKLVLSGTSNNPESRQASGRFELVNARLKDFPLFQTLGDAMHIADLSHMQLKQAQLDCRLNGTVLQVEPLLLVSNDLRITAQGRYLTSDDQLDLHARLVIDEAVSRQLPDFIGGQFKPCGDEEPQGSRFVDFDVTGPLNNPKSNLYNRVLGDPMKGFLHDLLSPKMKTPKDKSPKHHDVTPAAPPAAPAATGT